MTANAPFLNEEDIYHLKRQFPFNDPPRPAASGAGRSEDSDEKRPAGPPQDERLDQVLGALVRHLHAFAREIEPTSEEWTAAIERLTRLEES